MRRAASFLLACGAVMFSSAPVSGQGADVAAFDRVSARSDPIVAVIDTAGDGPSRGPRTPAFYDNGPLVTTPGGAGCGIETDLSEVQTLNLCLDLAGASVSGDGSSNYWLADDVALSCRARIDVIVLYAYETNASGVTITGGTCRVHAEQPVSPASSYVAETSALAGPVTRTSIYRSADEQPSCNRRVQMVRFAFNPPLNLGAGTYWLSWQLLGSGALTGPWAPPVTILGLTGKPGANARSSSNGGAFLPVVDQGFPGCEPAPPVPNPQDFPFQLEGALLCGCTGDGDGDGDTDQDDIDLVLFNYGTSVPPGSSGDLDGDGDVDQDDIDLVLFDFGCAP